MMRMWLAVIACVALAVVVVSLLQTPHKEAKAPVSSTTSTSRTEEQPRLPAPTLELIRTRLAALEISDEPTAPGYARELFPTWLDVDHNGCDARDDVLAAESQIPVVRKGSCEVVSGKWVSLYDGQAFTKPTQLDIDHMVPLANAWRSGASHWEALRRAEYANDTIDADHLIAVSARTNRSKGDQPPNEWRPPDESSWCRYATAWLNVKVKWALTATTPERDALGQMLETCPA